MRLLSPTLAALARAGTTVPALRLTVDDPTPHYERIASGGPRGRNDAVLAPDGAIVGAYHDGAATLYARRVAAPSLLAATPWTALSTSAAPGAGVAAARLDDRLRLLWQDRAGTALRRADSFDGGATWSAPALLFDPGAPLAALGADGEATPVFAASASASGWIVSAWEPSSGTGGAWRATPWPDGAATAVTGLDALHEDDGTFLIAVAARPTEASGTALRVYRYDSAAWSLLATVVPAGLANGPRRSDPRLSVSGDTYRLVVAVTEDASSSSVALASSRDGRHWSDPLDEGGAYAAGAVRLAHAEGDLLVAPDEAALSQPPGPADDLTRDIVSLEVVQRDGMAARLAATLHNGPNGRGAPYRASALLRPYARLRLWLDDAGTGAAPSYVFSVDACTHVRAGADDHVVVTASGPLALLDRRSPATLSYAAMTVANLVREVAARAGLLDTAIPDTARFAFIVPAFTIAAGSTWRAALERLATLYSWDVVETLDADGRPLLEAAERRPDDPVAWDAGDGAVSLSATTASAGANHVLVYGANGIVGEAWDHDDMAASGKETLLYVVEKLIVTADGAAVRAGGDLARARRADHGGTLALPLNPGLEPGDVVTALTGPAAAPSTLTVRLRVSALHHVCDPGAARYETIATCAGP